MHFMNKELFVLTLLLGFSFFQNAEACQDQDKTEKYQAVFKGSDDPNFEAAVDSLGGAANLNLPKVVYPGEPLVRDRILDGFEAAPSLRKLDDGTTIFWGFKYKEATYKSVAITDGNGYLCMVGAVTNVIPLLDAGSNQPIAPTNEAYQAKAAEYKVGPASIVLFVRNPKDLNVYLPIIKRWKQALLLNFIADCDAEKYKSSCELSQKIEVPISAYQPIFDEKKGGKSVKLKELTIPDLPAAAIPIKKFN